MTLRRTPERSLVPEPCRCAEKVGGLAQVLQRGTPTRGDRAKAPNYVAEARWRSQPATVKEPENSSLRRSRKWSHCRQELKPSLRHAPGNKNNAAATVTGRPARPR